MKITFPCLEIKMVKREMLLANNYNPNNVPKDKIAENFKVPGAFAIALTCLIGLYLVENIIVPMKYVCWATTAAAGIDALTFKNAYKQVEMLLPEQQKAYKHFGFIFTTTKNLEKVASVNGR